MLNKNYQNAEKRYPLLPANFLMDRANCFFWVMNWFWGYKNSMPTVGQDDVGRIPVEPAFLLVYAAEGNGQIFRLATLGSAVQVSTDGKQFMADNSQRESARWQEALDLLITWGWVKPVGRKGEVYEVTGTGYTKADWLKDDMCIDTSKEPLEELKQFEF